MPPVRTAEFVSRQPLPAPQPIGEQQRGVFPQGARLRPSASTNAYWESWQYGGRRILVLYVFLGIMLYLRSSRFSTATQQALTSAAVVESKTNDLCKEVYFIRHGEALHNRDAKLYEDFYKGRHLSPFYHDAPLTETGIDQARKLRELITQQYSFEPELIVSSTLTRAIQTAKGAYPNAPRIVATDLCRERIALYASDRRRSISELAKEFPGVDFSAVVDEHDTIFDTKKEIHPDPYDSDACKSRAMQFVDWLVHERPERTIVVVTHWVFLSHLLKVEQVENQKIFDNAEMRSIKLCRPMKVQ